MQIKCLYCESLIETEDINSCPYCGAPLAEALAAAKAEEEAKLKAEQAEAEAKLAAEQAEAKAQQEEEEKQEALRSVAAIAGSLFGIGAAKKTKKRRVLARSEERRAPQPMPQNNRPARQAQAPDRRQDMMNTNNTRRGGNGGFGGPGGQGGGFGGGHGGGHGGQGGGHGGQGGPGGRR